MPLVVAAEPLQGDEANFVCVAGAKGKVSGELESLLMLLLKNQLLLLLKK